ncbi:RNA-binding S4 domain-containing protein [Aurantiacibacter xanthus]|uniref:RNA-binding S4 domain-containing protein n=1 Tax=Aurantiacibacter xanthus TaxID=1784712 RepID=A0A3A1PFD1_9SPHN|nr:S4 domain-containing protein [Aurantiacibacter xanthus]RIV92296.1 RNA-binding S4 domain-containing protein [Aurantiacibacter xanthus]
MATGGGLRLDLLLVRLRFVRTRSAARQWVEQGHIRRNRQRITKPGALIATGDVLILPMPDHVRLIEILALPDRRGPASEAQQHYRALDDRPAIAIADRDSRPASGAVGPLIEGHSAP